MTQDHGAVLINALVVVLTISAVAVAMLTRSEAALQRAVDTRSGDQAKLYLDAAERLVPGLLREVSDEVITHNDQTWAKDGLTFPIDRAQISVKITDLTGRLNVNWLQRDDPYEQDVFRTVFADFDLPQSMIAALVEFVDQNSSVVLIDDLRAVNGMTPEIFATLSAILTALPRDTSINLNTADDRVKRATLAPLPQEVISLIMDRETPIIGMTEFRDLTIELLGTEDIDHLPFNRLSFVGRHFRAELSVNLDGRIHHRVAVFKIFPGDKNPVRRMYRWAVYD